VSVMGLVSCQWNAGLDAGRYRFFIQDLCHATGVVRCLISKEIFSGAGCHTPCTCHCLE
jgi:hypothetical protein